MVNEAGASIYSASEVAREEFPDLDLTVRGAVSIGRRLMDPLAELVKIDPKSIGVGQYQHDVDQNALKLMKSRFSYRNLPIRFGTLALLSSILCIILLLQKYADHLILGYDYPFSWSEVAFKIFVNYAYWLLLIPVVSIISESIGNLSGILLKKIVLIILSIILLAIIHAVNSQRTYDIFYYFCNDLFFIFS